MLARRSVVVNVDIGSPLLTLQLEMLDGPKEDSMAVTRTPTIDNPDVVNVATSTGQFLHFTVDVGGPRPIFTFASSVKGVLYEARDLPGFPTATKYEWDHLKNPSDIQQLELLQLRLSFFSNANYTYTVDLRNSSGLVGTVLQISYTGTPTDVEPESFTVVIV
jgi:hypothetical protein